MHEQLIEKLRDGKYITLETTPTHAATFEPIIDKIRNLDLDKKVDGFSTTDNPLARLKYGSLFASLKLQQSFNKPALATMTMRDRNKLALQSDLLGANEFDVRSIIALTGDSAKISDQPATKGVFEGDSTLLLDIIKCFNAGIDYAGKPFKIAPRPIYPFSVMNTHANNPKTLVRKLRKKIEHGTVGVITQPVFDIENARMLLSILKEAKEGLNDERKKAQLILGIFPITKLRTAQFLSSHVPGIHVPTSWVDKLYRASATSEEEEFKVGFELSKNLFDKIMRLHPKVHIMVANQFETAAKLLD